MLLGGWHRAGASLALWAERNSSDKTKLRKTSWNHTLTNNHLHQTRLAGRCVLMFSWWLFALCVLVYFTVLEQCGYLTPTDHSGDANAASLPHEQRQQQEELNIAINSSLSQLSFQPPIHPTQPGPSVDNSHEGGLDDSTEATQTRFKRVTDGKVEAGLGVTSAWAARNMFSCFWRMALTRSKNSTLSSEILPKKQTDDSSLKMEMKHLED